MCWLVIASAKAFKVCRLSQWASLPGLLGHHNKWAPVSLISFRRFSLSMPPVASSLHGFHTTNTVNSQSRHHHHCHFPVCSSRQLSPPVFHLRLPVVTVCRLLRLSLLPAATPGVQRVKAPVIRIRSEAQQRQQRRGQHNRCGS